MKSNLNSRADGLSGWEKRRLGGLQITILTWRQCPYFHNDSAHLAVVQSQDVEEEYPHTLQSLRRMWKLISSLKWLQSIQAIWVQEKRQKKKSPHVARDHGGLDNPGVCTQSSDPAVQTVLTGNKKVDQEIREVTRGHNGSVFFHTEADSFTWWGKQMFECWKIKKWRRLGEIQPQSIKKRFGHSIPTSFYPTCHFYLNHVKKEKSILTTFNLSIIAG